MNDLAARIIQRVSLLHVAVIVLTLVLTTSCLPHGAFTPVPSREPDNDGTGKPDEPINPGATPPPIYELVPPLWEETSSSTRRWTTHANSVVDRYGSELLLGTDDTLTFCPAYFSLAPQQKINFWVYLVSAMVKYESSFNPTLRFREGSMGTDPITREPVYSEGLLQLSYQDVLVYPFCDEFNWSIDRKLKRNDPKKTIFDPLKNLSCGIRILNRMIEKQQSIASKQGQYWSVLKPGHKNNKLVQIRKLTNALPFCQR